MNTVAKMTHQYYQYLETVRTAVKQQTNIISHQKAVRSVKTVAKMTHKYYQYLKIVRTLSKQD